MVIAGCGLNYDRLDVELQPCYTIQGKPGEIVVIDIGAITRDESGTHAKVGSEFIFRPIWLVGDREVSPREEYEVENFNIADKSVIDNVDGQLVALAAGETVVSCTIILKCRNGERRFDLKEKVHVFTPPPPQEEYKDVRPLPPMAVAFFIVNALTFTLICANITSCSKGAIACKVPFPPI